MRRTRCVWVVWKRSESRSVARLMRMQLQGVWVVLGCSFDEAPGRNLLGEKHRCLPLRTHGLPRRLAAAFADWFRDACLGRAVPKSSAVTFAFGLAKASRAGGMQRAAAATTSAWGNRSDRRAARRHALNVGKLSQDLCACDSSGN